MKFWQYLMVIGCLCLLLSALVKAETVTREELQELYRAGVKKGENYSEGKIIESIMEDVPYINTMNTPLLEPPTPSFWDHCMEANPKLNTAQMDKFTRLYACHAWEYTDRRIKVIAGWRTQEEHDKNVREGTSKVKTSLHQLGYAFDFSWCKNPDCTRLLGGKLSTEELKQLVYISGQLVGLRKFMTYFYDGFYSASDRVISSGGDWNCDSEIADGWDWWHLQAPPSDIAKKYACTAKPNPLEYL